MTRKSTGWWDRVEVLFAELLEVPEGEREAFLDRVCGDDEALRGELERLLASDPGEVERLAATLPKLVDGAAGDPLPQDGAFDRYRLLEELDRGGMGEVFLAVREDDPARRRVAVKILRGDWGKDAEFVRRFRREQGILARLEHPHVARLYDWGTTSDGRPYLAMEYVDGEPIDAYCRSASLSVGERLRLFRKVCDAVQFAHRNAVIHRDLKPSNVLVTPAGEPKLLDFGIAKLLDADGAFADSTQSLLLFTPRYASPEQFRGEPISTLSDVYSLGVVLYEILTGRHPFPLADVARREYERLVCEEDPEKPSTAVTREARGREVSAGTGRELAETRRSLAGDVDRIVLKALAKRPGRRYSSAEQLSEDLGRHLAGFPVLAQEPTWGYRARKFLRRHRLYAGLAAALLGLLVTFAAVLFAEQRRTARERDRAERVQALLVEVFRSASPVEHRGEPPSVREVLDSGLRRLRGENEAPDVWASLLGAAGLVYYELGEYAVAREVLEDAVASWDAAGEPDRAQQGIALTHLGMTLRNLELFDAAETRFEESLEIQRRRGDAAEVASNLMHLANLWMLRGDYASAEPWARRALEIDRRSFAERPGPELASTLNVLGMILRRLDRPAEGEALFREAIAIQRELLGDDHLELAKSLNNLALVLSRREDFEPAEAAYREALAIKRKAYGGDHAYVASTIHNLGALLLRQGRLEEAETELREALAMRRRTLGDRSSGVAQTLSALATLLAKRGDLEPAEAPLLEAFEIRREVLGERHPDVALEMYNLGYLYQRLGDPEAAESFYRRALEIDLEVTGEGSWAVVRDRLHLASLLESAGRSEECEELARRALEALPRHRPEDHWLLAAARSVLGGCLADLGRHAEAEPLVTASLPVLEAALGAGDPRTREASRRLAELRAALP